MLLLLFTVVKGIRDPFLVTFVKSSILALP
jgi:hypothetical protein